MLVEKEKLKKKMLKEFDDDNYWGKHQCSICRQTITKYDIENLNFEYVKNKLGENYAHSSCIKYRKNKHKK